MATYDDAIIADAWIGLIHKTEHRMRHILRRIAHCTIYIHHFSLGIL